MNKFKSIFKVLTFLDVEIAILCIMMLLSIYFCLYFMYITNCYRYKKDI